MGSNPGRLCRVSLGQTPSLTLFHLCRPSERFVTDFVSSRSRQSQATVLGAEHSTQWGVSVGGEHTREDRCSLGFGFILPAGVPANRYNGHYRARCSSIFRSASSNRSAGDRSPRSVVSRSQRSLKRSSSPRSSVPCSKTAAAKSGPSVCTSTTSTSSVPSARVRAAISPKNASLNPSSPGRSPSSSTAISTSLSECVRPVACEPNRIASRTGCSSSVERTHRELPFRIRFVSHYVSPRQHRI